MGFGAFLVVILTFIANLLIGLVVYRNNPRSWTNRLTAGLALIFSFWTVFNYFALLPGSEMTRIFWVRIVMLVTTPMGILTYYLSKGFPGDKLKVNKPILYITIPLVCTIALFAISPWMFSRVENLPNDSFNLIPGPAIFLFAISHLGLTTLGLIILFKKYLKSSGLLKKQVFYFLLGTILTLTLITITNFVAVVFFSAMQYTFIGPTFTLFQVGFLTYAILRHRLFDVRVLVVRTVTYTLLLLSSATLIIASTISTSKFLSDGSSSTIFYTIVALGFAILFNPLKTAFESLTKNIFYKQSYSSEEFLETLGEIIRSNISISPLTKKVMQRLNVTMHVSKSMFLILDKDQPAKIRSLGYPDNLEFTENTLHNLTKTADNQLILFDELEEGTSKILLREHSFSVLMPLRVKSTHHGFLILGEKASGEIYSQQDIDVLEILKPQLSIAIQNSKSYDEIKHFADTLKEEVDIATRDLKKANNDLRHLDKLKDEFVFIATHELKNPVTAMRGYVSLLKEGVFGPIPEKMKDPLNQLDTSNQQLVHLVNDLLQIARTEAKTLTFQTETVDLCSIVDGVIGTVKPLYEQKHLLVTHTCPTKNLTVKADLNKLKEIVNNLVSNAIKYSEKGTIDISHESKDGQVITKVKDQGDGIPQKDHAKIFTRFFRVEEEAAKGIPGTGLGLFIVKQLVEKMGGKIWFESTLGVGTTFYFSLPKA